jgi:hypothetical protein
MSSLRNDEPQLSDVELAANAGAVLSVPRAAPADSFVLHSALELTARSALLPFVHPGRRSEARARLVELAEKFEASGAPVAPPPARDFPSTAAAADRLLSAVAAGDLDETDAAACWLGRAASPTELQDLVAERVLASLAAAAHAPIFFHLLPRVAPRRELSGELLRGLARELARHPQWRLRWIDETPATGAGRSREGDDAALFAALAHAPRLGVPESTFIYPLMSRVDTDELAGTILRPLTSGADIGARARSLLRVAAWSMLDEPGEHAPYGWSHCLTMPQAVLGVAPACTDPARALAIAATFVLGFRASLATRDLVPAVPTERPRFSVAEALGCDPETAAAVLWHAPPGEVGAVVSALATAASCHEDAHLVKYTLACLDAAAADPAARRLYLAAAGALIAWWARADSGVAAA